MMTLKELGREALKTVSPAVLLTVLFAGTFHYVYRPHVELSFPIIVTLAVFSGVLVWFGRLAISIWRR